MDIYNAIFINAIHLLYTEKSIKTIFITGSNSGIGLELCQKLDKQGWSVFAGFFPGADTSRMIDGVSSNFLPIPIDITKKKSIQSALKIVEKSIGQGNGIDVLLNNAGIASPDGNGPFEGISENGMRKIFDVNLFGTMEVIRIFLPLLQNTKKSRIINITSGAVTAPPPISAPYNMSKAAIHTLTQTLRLELSHFPILVASIEPGVVRTTMTDNVDDNFNATWNAIEENIQVKYKESLKGAVQALKDVIRKPNEPADIADGIIKVIYTKKPNIRNRVGKERWILSFLYACLPEETFEKILRLTYKIK